MKESYILAKQEWLNSSKSITEIAKEFSIGRQNFSSFLKKEGIWEDRRIQYKINRNFFKEINSPEKGYLLGFIAADGCVIEDSRGNLKGVDISLQKSDKDFLISVANLLGESDRIVKERQKCYSLRITSSEMASDLTDLGIYPQKSLTLDLSKVKVPESFKKDFLRGYFDGDGCFFFKKYDYGERSLISFTGTLESLTYIRQQLQENCNCSLGTVTQRNPENATNNYTIQWQGSKQIKSILSYLHSSQSKIFLLRKQQMINSFLQNH